MHAGACDLDGLLAGRWQCLFGLTKPKSGPGEPGPYNGWENRRRGEPRTQAEACATGGGLVVAGSGWVEVGWGEGDLGSVVAGGGNEGKRAA